MSLIADPLVERVIGCAIAVHRELGPGLLESAYRRCLCCELDANAIAFKTEVDLPLIYRGARVECGYRIDILVEGWLVIEVKSVERLLPVHTAQTITYVTLSGSRQGLILNFNATTLKEGLKSVLPRGSRDARECG